MGLSVVEFDSFQADLGGGHEIFFGANTSHSVFLSLG
jgi:hypothetical protein